MNELPLQAQAEIQEGRAREAAFQAALQDVTLFKSRTSAALLQAQERAEAAQVSSTLTRLAAPGQAM